MSDPGHVLAVCRVHQLRTDQGAVGVTAIDKRPVNGPVMVRELGLYGDVQADRQHHGGPDQAVYAFSQEETAFWSVELGRAIDPGAFGENLRTVGVAVDDAELGERWRVGEELLLEVTAPRVPCAVFGRWVEQPAWVRRFTERGRPGAYLRVLHRGAVTAGDTVRVVQRPGHGVTVAGWFSGNTAQDARTLVEFSGDTGWALSPAMRTQVDRSLRRAARQAAGQWPGATPDSSGRRASTQ
ncbi:MAG TPA: MOSC domain-containing protein [Actinomycetales bacterium]|nr:MOSC domain-containing protein [Actinomycetales bacterium]